MIGRDHRSNENAGFPTKGGISEKPVVVNGRNEHRPPRKKVDLKSILGKTQKAEGRFPSAF
jgi:hypothetical protein